MRSLPGKQLAIKLEAEDGTAYAGNAIAAHVEINSIDPFYRTYADDRLRQAPPSLLGWTMELIGSGELSVTGEIFDRYRRVFTAIEWRCEWCGSINRRERMKCSQCSATRTFLYELMQHAHRSW